MAGAWSGVLVTCFVSQVANSATSKFKVDYGIDGTATGLAFAAGLLVRLTPVDREGRWNSELFPFDDATKGNFSMRAAALSDILQFATIVAPLAAQLPFGANEELAQTTLIFGETLGGSFLITSVAKYLIQRPRPYVYSTDPFVQAYAQKQGEDSRLSFFSGHSAIAFSSAVAGAYLFALSSTDTRARAIFWGAELALATATANLRVLAGRHFYSDVFAGALVGAAIGILVPYLHTKPSIRYSPKAEEWAAMGGGIIAGALVSQLLPINDDVCQPNAALSGSATSHFSVSVVPASIGRGAGLRLIGLF